MLCDDGPKLIVFTKADDVQWRPAQPEEWNSNSYYACLGYAIDKLASFVDAAAVYDGCASQDGMLRLDNFDGYYFEEATCSGPSIFYKINAVVVLLTYNGTSRPAFEIWNGDGNAFDYYFC